MKRYAMIPEEKLKISLQELALKGAKIIAQQSEISFAQAFQQVQRLKKTSKVNQSQRKAGSNFKKPLK